jgi:DNA-binding NarL/FixJ family response regulator
LIRVVIADDQALVRGGFTVMVRAAPGMEVVGEAGDDARAVELAREHHPDVILMDVRMPVLDGIEATRVITTDPGTAGARILILTTFDLDDYVYRALRAGASGFLLKDTAPEDMLAAHDRAQLVMIAYETRLVTTGSYARGVTTAPGRSTPALLAIPDGQRAVI